MRTLCTFLALSGFFTIFLENAEKKSLESGGFREGRSGYSKHNFFFRLIFRYRNCLKSLRIAICKYKDLAVVWVLGFNEALFKPKIAS